MHRTICVPDFERSPRTVLDEVVHDAEVLARFREVRAEMEERNSGFSDEEIERDVEAVLSKTAR